jgi:hypothetical protein
MVAQGTAFPAHRIWLAYHPSDPCGYAAAAETPDAGRPKTECFIEFSPLF